MGGGGGGELRSVDANNMLLGQVGGSWVTMGLLGKVLTGWRTWAGVSTCVCV